jgi:2-C-methyl-D-erythritol 2,4-cyclodiphosphate synthase
MSFRIGHGFDAHQLVKGVELIIGGVNIPSDKGSEGHSDGDVLLHAIVDALLGALSLGDIGQHFPSTNSKWKNANSSEFVKYAFQLVQNKGFLVNNLDSTIILQTPHLNIYMDEMKNNIASMLAVDISNISVKATTTDHLGFTGRGDGIAATATILLKEA